MWSVTSPRGPDLLEQGPAAPHLCYNYNIRFLLLRAGGHLQDKHRFPCHACRSHGQPQLEPALPGPLGPSPLPQSSALPAHLT